MPEGGGLGHWMKKVKKLSSKSQLQYRHGDVRWSIGNMVNSTVITVAPGGHLNHWKERSVTYMNV